MKQKDNDIEDVVTLYALQFRGIMQCVTKQAKRQIKFFFP